MTGYIRQGIRKEVRADRIFLYLPFFFGEGQEEICLTWDEKGILSDGGRTFAELKKRVGDLAPYRDSIQAILEKNGRVTLEAGHKLVVRHAQTCVCSGEVRMDYLHGLSRLLRVMSLISVVDTVTVSADGTVISC